MNLFIQTKYSKEIERCEKYELQRKEREQKTLQHQEARRRKEEEAARNKMEDQRRKQEVMRLFSKVQHITQEIYSF